MSDRVALSKPQACGAVCGAESLKQHAAVGSPRNLKTHEISAVTEILESFFEKKSPVCQTARIQTTWNLLTRITSLRAGVGSPVVSLKAKTTVLNDAGEDNSLIGGTGTDWYFRALYDSITGLLAGESLDVL